jgi:hypothetical protein
VKGATASRRERFREGDGLIEIPASFGPVSPRYAHADWPLDRKDPADGIECFEGKTHSVFEAAAVVVVALVGQGREKLMQQITVRAMELDCIEPEPGGSPLATNSPRAMVKVTPRNACTCSAPRS